MSAGPKDRTIRGTGAHNDVSAALAYLDDYQSVVMAQAAALRRAFAGRASAVKELARAANINERTAENLLSAKGAPSFQVALKLMASVPEYAAEVRRLTRQHDDMDPEFERDLIKLMQSYSARRP